MLLRSLRSACRRRILLPPMLSRMMPTPTVVPQRMERQWRLLSTGNLKEQSSESSSDTKAASKPEVVKYWCAMGEGDEPDPSLFVDATSMEDLIETVSGAYGLELGEFKKENHSIEVYDEGKWLPVLRIEELKKYQHDGDCARIRVPKLYLSKDSDFFYNR